MYHIDILTDSTVESQALAIQTGKICSEHGLFPVIETHHDMEAFFARSQQTPPVSVILALPGVAGLNTAEHLRTLYPDCGLIWCSNLDFSLHAFKLRAEYFMLAPASEETLREGLQVWIQKRARRFDKTS